MAVADAVHTARTAIGWTSSQRPSAAPCMPPHLHSHHLFVSAESCAAGNAKFTHSLPSCRETGRGSPAPFPSPLNLGPYIARTLHITGHSEMTSARPGPCLWLPNIPRVPLPPSVSPPTPSAHVPTSLHSPRPSQLPRELRVQDVQVTPISLPSFCPGILPLGFERSNEIENTEKRKIAG